jgi:hypothetical protein
VTLPPEVGSAYSHPARRGHPAASGGTVWLEDEPVTWLYMRITEHQKMKNDDLTRVDRERLRLRPRTAPTTRR